MTQPEPHRGIFVGSHWVIYGGDLHYGHAGECLKPNRSRIAAFKPDGCDRTIFIPRRYLYFPSLEPTRHCPKL